jgi:uncharacterized protein YprB with RNaseH-like and TPR domain
VLDESALASLLGATVVRTEFGSHLSVRNWHATPEYPQISSAALDVLSRTADLARSKELRAAVSDPEKWLFLDTETTGLAGGTGTYAFLIGIAWWDGGGLQVEQFLMRDFSEEHSLLLELAARLAERPVLVTFNGKTFDWPLLENRFRMTRCIRVPELAAHLDLLHPARAVWRMRLGSVRLVELERHVLDAQRLGWHREDDVPSSLIPQFYFDYLRGGSVAPLAGVVRHNRMDLRGLAALFGKLNSLLGANPTDESGKTDALDLFGLARYLQRKGEAARAESACEAARDRGLPLPFDAQAQCELARMAKRRGEHHKAAKIWEQLLLDEERKALACEELAIHHERRCKNLKPAVEFARLGLKHLRRPTARHGLTAMNSGELQRLERLHKRVQRLEKRIASIAARAATPLLRQSRRRGC